MSGPKGITPAPWVVNVGEYDFIDNALYRGQIGFAGVLTVEGSPDRFLMVCEPNNRGVAYEEYLPNAHLCAAAPDLYDALSQLVEHYTGLVASGDCGYWDAEQEEAVKAARAALAKAEGQQS